MTDKSKIIVRLLYTGHTRSTKYRTKDLQNYLWFTRGLFRDTENGIIADAGNPFWNAANKENRLELAEDICMIHRATATDHGYFHIINRLANGKGYGIEQNTHC